MGSNNGRAKTKVCGNRRLALVNAGYRVGAGSSRNIVNLRIQV